MVERGKYMGCVGEGMGRGSSIPSHSLQFRRSLSPPTRAAGREQRREYMVVAIDKYKRGRRTTENKAEGVVEV
ncbi:hypothetical protein Bca4012_063285 [Brassica carinata]